MNRIFNVEKEINCCITPNKDISAIACIMLLKDVLTNVKHLAVI